MFLTRWKMMAGLLAVSLGGLAAMAGPCSKDEPTKGAPPPDVPTAADAASPPMMPHPRPPSLPPIPAPDTAPAVLPVIQTGGATPPAAEPVLLPLPATPTANPVETPSARPVSGRTEPKTMEVLPPSIIPSISVPQVSKPSGPPVPPPMSIPVSPMVDCPPPAPVSHVRPVEAVSAVVQTKYRILLRVGEGEPIFEVRSGDHLILKVVCEKVDVKSPEQGQGLSAVKAYGKVRFAGFGAEGTCDELNFLAGTGEVAMTGHVMIQVKDKLGRVESELSAETMRYRIDPHTTPGNGLLKP